MEAPPVQYVSTSDGINVAYSVSGSGRALVFVPNLVTHAMLSWQRPDQGRWLRALSERFRLVAYDSRGSGMSTRGLRPDHSFDDYQLDLEAVIDGTHLDRFVLCGQGSGAQIALRYAARRPDKVAALVLVGAGLSLQVRRAGELMYISLPEQDWEMFLYTIASTASLGGSIPKTVEIMRQSVTQEEWLRSRPRHRFKDDSETIYKQLRVPTLVLHQRDFVELPIEASMKVAQLSKGQLVVIDGADFLGDETQAMSAIETFLAELSPPGRSPEQPPRIERLGGLSARELEVLHLIADGQSNPQIAAELVISLNTVQRHVSNILIKTGLNNRTEVAVYARDRGFGREMTLPAIN